MGDESLQGWRLKGKRERLPSSSGSEVRKSQKKKDNEADEEMGIGNDDIENVGILLAITTIQKLVLQNSHRVRELISSTWIAIVMPAAMCIIAAAQTEGKLYADKVKELGKGHGLGSPHTHILCSVIDSICSSPDTPANDLTIMKQLQTVLKGMSQEQVSLLFP